MKSEFGGSKPRNRGEEIRSAINKSRLADAALVGLNAPCAPAHIELWSRGEVGKSILLGLGELAVSAPLVVYERKQRAKVEAAREEIAAEIEQVQGSLGDLQGDLALHRYQQRETIEGLKELRDKIYDSLSEDIRRQIDKNEESKPIDNSLELPDDKQQQRED